MTIPAQLLRQLYVFGSLQSEPSGYRFGLKNRLLEVVVEGLRSLRIDGESVPLEAVSLRFAEEPPQPARPFGPPRTLAVRDKVSIHVQRSPLAPGHHQIALGVLSKAFGELCIEVEDVLDREEPCEPEPKHLPHDDRDDYSMSLVEARQRFVREQTGVDIEHITRFSFKPESTRGNIENFTGVAQVPMGFAGPIRIDGEHAQGEYLVPMATTEGTLVASYNRGIKVLNLSGGAKTTVSCDAMQRAPVFIFDSAREARDFCAFIDRNGREIAKVSEQTSSVAKLLYIDHYLSNKFAYLRFNFSTGDAAGQNMVGRATFAACEWIVAHAADVKGFYLEANLATDKKHSHINIMHTRGKRVTAEATIPRDVLVRHMRVTPEALHKHASLGTIGAILSGASNNGAHTPNGITAIFIATGQDVANVAESSAAILYTEVTPDGDLYVSLTIPSLIVATHGGGTGLPTQRECLRIMKCEGPGTAKRLAEIIAGVALAGELSLGAAISSLDWVSSHERMGRHR